MNLPKYPLSSSDKMMTFEFLSEGNKGLIHKLVKYQPTNLKGLHKGCPNFESSKEKVLFEIKRILEHL